MRSSGHRYVGQPAVLVHRIPVGHGHRPSGLSSTPADRAPASFPDPLAQRPPRRVDPVLKVASALAVARWPPRGPMPGWPGASGWIGQMPGEGGPGGGLRDNAAGGQARARGCRPGLCMLVLPVLPGYRAVVAMGRSWRAVLGATATRSR